jgi:hypothetical protein
VFWRIDLGARGPGIALRDILLGADVPTRKARIIAHLEPDVLVLSGLDYDYGMVTAHALRDMIADHGTILPYSFAFPSNAGLRTNHDMTGDGRDHSADDTQGYGNFSGQRGLVLFSRYPIDTERARDFSGFLWRDLPGAQLPAPEWDIWDMQRLSSTGHWDIPIRISEARQLNILVYQAGPPVFGGARPRNLYRNHDETAFWVSYLAGQLPMPPPGGPFVLMGGSNLDPYDGDGLNSIMRALLQSPALQDPRPESRGAVHAADHGASRTHIGPHAQDTVYWPRAPGNLRVSYILPSAGLSVMGTGVFWPTPNDPEAALFGGPDASAVAHKPVWLEIDPRSIAPLSALN